MISNYQNILKFEVLYILIYLNNIKFINLFIVIIILLFFNSNKYIFQICSSNILIYLFIIIDKIVMEG